MFNQILDRGYFISIGGDRKMFTLRQGNALGHEWHIQNLSHTWEDAEAKAFEVTGFHLPAPECILNPLKSHETIDTALMPWGKYKGQNINEIAVFDLQYLNWMVTNDEEVAESDPDHKTDRTIKLIAKIPKLIEFRAEQARIKSEREAKWKAEREALQASSKHLGTIDERIKFTGTVTFTKFFENEWGYGSMTKVITDCGSEVMYWNTFGVDASELGFTGHKLDAAKGDRIEFMAAVKAHGEYEGTKQTTVKRATKGKLLSAGKETADYINTYAA